MSLDNLYISNAVVQQLATSQNAMGGAIKVYSTRIASLRCRMWPKRVTEKDEFGKMTARELWKLACAADTANLQIARSDRIVISNRTFEITGIGNPSFMNHHLEIDLREID